MKVYKSISRRGLTELFYRVPKFTYQGMKYCYLWIIDDNEHENWDATRLIEDGADKYKRL